MKARTVTLLLFVAAVGSSTAPPAMAAPTETFCTTAAFGDFGLTDRPDCYGVVRAVAVAAGWDHLCILLEFGNVDCNGAGNDDKHDDYVGGDAIAVDVGAIHTCVLRMNGNVNCYGDSAPGMNYVRGDAIGVATSEHDSCMLLETGNVICYGHGNTGLQQRYGSANGVAISAGRSHACVLTNVGTVNCFQAAGNPTPLAGYTGGDAVALSAGTDYTCALVAAGNVHCFGSNPPLSDYTNGDVAGVSAGHDQTCIVLVDGNVECYGNSSWQDPVRYRSGDAMAVSVGLQNTCILIENGDVRCFGKDPNGEAINYVANPRAETPIQPCFRYNPDAATNACATIAPENASYPVPTADPQVEPNAEWNICVIGFVCAPSADPTITPNAGIEYHEVPAVGTEGYVELTMLCGELPECQIAIP